jgi:hypothetical protein
MRTDGRRGFRRPRGAVLRPLGLLIAAVAGGFGMWHALMQDRGPGHASRLSRRDGHPFAHVSHDARP